MAGYRETWIRKAPERNTAEDPPYTYTLVTDVYEAAIAVSQAMYDHNGGMAENPVQEIDATASSEGRFLVYFNEEYDNSPIMSLANGWPTRYEVHCPEFPT